MTFIEWSLPGGDTVQNFRLRRFRWFRREVFLTCARTNDSKHMKSPANILKSPAFNPIRTHTIERSFVFLRNSPKEKIFFYQLPKPTISHTSRHRRRGLFDSVLPMFGFAVDHCYAFEDFSVLTLSWLTQTRAVRGTECRSSRAGLISVCETFN